MTSKIATKLSSLTDDERVSAALHSIFLFEADQGPDGGVYKKRYKEILEKHLIQTRSESGD